MHPFTYEAPTSLDAALGQLGAAAPRAALLAGGTDLIVQLRGGQSTPDAVIDVKRIPELRRLQLDDTELCLGAAVSCWELSRNEDVRSAYPGLMEAAELIGSMQIQGRATVGGNLCNASPAADTIPALIAIGALAVVASADGERQLPVEEFVVGPGRNALHPGELLVELRVPPAAERSADAYLRFTPRAEMDIAVVGAAVNLETDETDKITAARVALGAVAPRPLLVAAAADALIGTSLDAAALAALDAAAQAACNPIDDKRGTIEYRTKVAGVIARRTAEIAYKRARS